MHLLGVVLGLGGATIADLLFFKFLREFEISKKDAEILRLLSRVIVIAFSNSNCFVGDSVG
jgi:hypothetical protein